MYEIRFRSVLAYVKHVFSAGMSSSQRSESGHSFMKKYINRKNSLMGFITRFNRALVHQRHEELVANHIDLTEQPRLTSVSIMEHQMVQIYTKSIFMSFQKEVEQSNFYICSKRLDSVDAKVYGVERFESGKTFERQRVLTYFTNSDFIACSSGMFEFEGYPCRHMLSYFKKKQVLLLPEKYILQRWTKNAKVRSVHEHMGGPFVDNDYEQSLMGRHGMLSYKASLLVDDASLTDAHNTYLLGEFDKLCINLKEIDNGGNVVMNKIGSKSREESPVVGDPNAVRAKGCGKRLKSSKEKAIYKGSRHCRSYGGHGHDKRTCPNLQNR